MDTYPVFCLCVLHNLFCNDLYLLMLGLQQGTGLLHNQHLLFVLLLDPSSQLSFTQMIVHHPRMLFMIMILLNSSVTPSSLHHHNQFLIVTLYIPHQTLTFINFLIITYHCYFHHHFQSTYFLHIVFKYIV